MSQTGLVPTSITRLVCMCGKQRVNTVWEVRLLSLTPPPSLFQPCSTGKIKAEWTSTSLPACGSTSQTGRTSSGPTTGTTPASSIRMSSNRRWLDSVSSKVCFDTWIRTLWWRSLLAVSRTVLSLSQKVRFSLFSSPACLWINSCST